MTNVKFLIEKGSKSDIVALFPDVIENEFTSKNGIKLTAYRCYSHTGQHSSGNLDYFSKCKEANFNQYWDLLRELIGQRYNDLNILNSQTIQCHRNPTEGEIKFGEGATHYRDFTLAEIGITKKGNIKKWFIAPDDKLRYYTT